MEGDSDGHRVERREDALYPMKMHGSAFAASWNTGRRWMAKHRQGITSPRFLSEMARRIEAWLGPERGGRAEIWLGMQMDYDLSAAKQKPAPKVTRAPEVPAA